MMQTSYLHIGLWQQGQRPKQGAAVDQGPAAEEGRLPESPSDQDLLDPLVATEQRGRREGEEELDRELGLGAGATEEREG